MDQIVQLISDVLLAAGAFGAAAYCMVLARRLKRFNTLENGVGGAVAVLSAQVDDMTKTLDAAQEAAAVSSVTLTDLTVRAEAAARKLELMMAALHDLPATPLGYRDVDKVPPSSPSQTGGAGANDNVSGPIEKTPEFTSRRHFPGRNAA